MSTVKTNKSPLHITCEVGYPFNQRKFNSKGGLTYDKRTSDRNFKRA